MSESIVSLETDRARQICVKGTINAKSSTMREPLKDLTCKKLDYSMNETNGSRENKRGENYFEEKAMHEN